MQRHEGSAPRRKPDDPQRDRLYKLMIVLAAVAVLLIIAIIKKG